MDIEAGGFDDGQGETNVSKSAEPDNIVRTFCTLGEMVVLWLVMMCPQKCFG